MGRWKCDANARNYYGYRMQPSEREGCGPEASPSVMPEAPLESPPAPAKSPTFDLFNLVLSYKRLEIYLEPLKDAGDGVRHLLRYRLGRVALTCWASCLPALWLCWPFRQWLGCPFCPGEGPLGLWAYSRPPLSQAQPRRGRHWEPSGLSLGFVLCG